MKPYFRSLRTRLAFWFLSVTMFSLIAVVTIIYFQRSAVIRAMEFEKLQVIRDLKVRELEHWLGERTNDLEVASGDYEIRGLEEILSKKKDEWSEEERTAVSTARALLQRYLADYDAYHELFIIDAASGRVTISSNPTREGLNKRTDAHSVEPLRTKIYHIKDIYYSRTEGVPAMAFSIPIFCLAHEGEHLIGVLVARADLEQVLYPMLQNRTGEGETGETLVVNRDGVAVNELRHHQNAPLKLKIKAQPATLAAAGETGVVETEDYRGERVLAAYTHIPLTKWGFVVKRDLAEVYAPIHAMLRDMALIVVVAALIVTLVSLLLAGTISGPILAIGETVGRFTAGDFEARCPAAGADEVAALGASFNDMAATLKSQMAVQRGSAELGETMVSAAGVEEFSTKLLMNLIAVSGSHLGAFYRRGADGRTFECAASVGLTGAAAPSFNGKIYEGELGKALATGEISFIRDIPASTAFIFKTTAGTAIPRELVTIPLAVEDRIMAVVSLATLDSYHDFHRQILEQAQPGMCTALASLLAAARTQSLAEELRAGNEELTMVNEELQAQAAELEAQRLQVEEANRLKSEFLSNMSHELRTPLNSVMALSQLMLARGVGAKPEDDTEHMRVIERNGRQLLNLINDILDLAKIEAGRMEAALGDFDPRELVESILATMRPLAEERGLSLAANVAELPRMHSDGERLGQILLNLLTNAVKFTERGGITLDVSAAGGEILFAVQDTGIGISAADLPHIFEEFRQVDGSTTRRYESTGLGLAICQKLARLLGGEIAVESVAGEGSTFTLTVPVRCPAMREAANGLQAKAADAERARPRPRPRGPVRAQPLVLVVEDNETAARQVRSALEERGYVVVVARGGAAALDAVSEDVPDAIVLDLMLPEMDGFQVLERLRSMPGAEDVPVLVLTAKEPTAEDRARLTRNNIHQLIRKGDVDRDELVACVAGMLEREGAVEEPLSPPPAPKEALAPPAERGKTVLIVEDHPDSLLTIKAILDSIGCQYVIAEDGERAVRIAEESQPGLILMDIQLPVLSGLEALRRIKAHPAPADTPIVALTARAMKGDREEILAAGCDDYLSKPLDAAALTRMVRKWLGTAEETS